MGRKRTAPKRDKSTPRGEFAHHLQEVASKAQATNADIADRVGVNPDSVAKWMRGDAIRCRECYDASEAIASVEAAEGCPEHSRRPLWGQLDSALEWSNDGDRYYPAIKEALGERWDELRATMHIREVEE